LRLQSTSGQILASPAPQSIAQAAARALVPALSGKTEPRTRAEDAAIDIRQAEAAGRIPVSILTSGWALMQWPFPPGLFGAHARNGNRVPHSPHTL